MSAGPRGWSIAPSAGARRVAAAGAAVKTLKPTLTESTKALGFEVPVTVIVELPAATPAVVIVSRLEPGGVTGAVLLAAGWFTVLLAENCRVPFDDPNTHLELTMIHEVMVLDHGSADLGFVLWGSCLKLWVLGALWVGLVLPGMSGRPLADLAAGIAGLLGLAVATGIVESITARVRLLRVPQLLVGAGVLCTLGLLLTFR